ncbi:hypothetical protein SAMN02745165_02420 [Malonomonas rubra DSM 5091]|uniref:Uncharacterized protein n=1 Tax=Malonomonas rubra DSM 5091 TaxID=1122189 RepID=A0A1M6JEN5_MALRU|nr:hypothetical protein [Malonomonas rubra]SHJ45157.1 hypothetical protein SAMN02745165_02420 [Malonomonas rubra DSM 5091]
MNNTEKGKQMLEEVALRYAEGHGLRPTVEWVDQGYEWLLRLNTDEHTVRVGFSIDEIEFFVDGSAEENRDTKMKIRNAFASLSM